MKTEFEFECEKCGYKYTAFDDYRTFCNRQRGLVDCPRCGEENESFTKVPEKNEIGVLPFWFRSYAFRSRLMTKIFKLVDELDMPIEVIEGELQILGSDIEEERKRQTE